MVSCPTAELRREGEEDSPTGHVGGSAEATGSEAGELRTARLLSAHTTCRLQRHSMLVYLTEAISAHARGDPVPLLT